jgi:hypothetical protein
VKLFWCAKPVLNGVGSIGKVSRGHTYFFWHA